MKQVSLSRHLRLITCPYCHSIFDVVILKNNFGILECTCTQFPIIEGIVLLKKDDAMTNVSIVNLIRTGNYVRAVWQSLIGNQKAQRILVFAWYLVFKKFKILLSRRKLLQLLLRVAGASRGWYRYLLARRGDKPELIHASVLVNELENDSVIVDIGTGIGFLYEKIRAVVQRTESVIVGTDKNFLSMLIARLYNLDKNYVLVCTDADVGLPFRNNSVNYLFYIDSFYQLFGTSRQIVEAQRVLKKVGKLCLLQLFTNNRETKNWGYGIPPSRINYLMLHAGFSSITFFNNKSTEINGRPFSQINVKGYSCIASKTNLEK